MLNLVKNIFEMVAPGTQFSDHKYLFNSLAESNTWAEIVSLNFAIATSSTVRVK